MGLSTGRSFEEWLEERDGARNGPRGRRRSARADGSGAGLVSTSTAAPVGTSSTASPDGAGMDTVVPQPRPEESDPPRVITGPVASAPPAVDPGAGAIDRARDAAESARQAAALLDRARELIRQADALLAPLPRLTASDPGVRGGRTDDGGHADAALHDEDALVTCVEVAERIAAVASSAQRRASVAYRASRIAAQRAAGVAARDLGRGVAEEIALARRITPTAASNQIALGRVIVESLPCTESLLAAGEISAWAADEVAKAVITLSDADRARVDADLAPRLPEVTARRAGALARARAAELDQEAALARMRREVDQRAVTIRPVSDVLVRVSALLPTAQGVAVYAALDRTARGARAQGDERSRGQHMADTLFSRVTGLERVEHADVELQLLMTDRALLGGGADTAWLDGHPLPAQIARHLALGGEPGCAGAGAGAGADGDADGGAGAATAGKDRDPVGGAGIPASSSCGTTTPPDVRRFIRRLYTDPDTGALRDADTRRRLFTGAVRSHVLLRDRHCRGPWCDGAIAHVHHVQGWAEGGDTTADNGVGTCARLNLAVEMPGWSTASEADGTLRITTPTGREHRSPPPPLRQPDAEPP